LPDVIEVGSVSSIAKLTVKRGSKAFGRLTIGKSLDGSLIEMPFAVIKGAREGPKMWVQGTLHGDEFAGGETVRRIINEFTPKELSGTVIAVPVVSTTAFSAHMRYSFIDNKDLDFSFTNNPSGTFSERFACLLLDEITSTLTDQDFMFDLHGSPGGTLMQPWVAYHATGDRAEEKSRVAAEASGVRVVYKITPVKEWTEQIGESTTLADEYLPTSFAIQMLKRVKADRLVIESGSDVVMGNDVEVQCTGVLNVMKHVGMLEGSPIQPAEDKVYISNTRRAMAKNRGFWRPIILPGENVFNGQRLALVTDEYGRKIEDITAPTDGILLINRLNSYVDPLSGVLSRRYGAFIGY
jgi:predicted deacylase